MALIINSSNNKKIMNLNLVIFGDYKVGKTFLSSTVPDALVMSVEDGMLSVAGKGVDYLDCKDMRTAKEIVNAVKTNPDFKKYKWLFLDTVTEFGQLLYPVIREKHEQRAKENKSKGADGRQVWGEFAESIGLLVKAMRGLDLNIVILASSTQKEDDQNKIFNAPDIYGQSSSRIVGWLDEVFYMFVDKDGKRKFLTAKTDRTVAGDRSGKLDAIEDADLMAIHKKILG